ncbi:MAG: 2-amino-4-hydroxy-6-hydroxymethyldihydropteridine diphosphokinase [Ginsengibacter sp.]
MNKAYLLLGGNIGNRLANLETAKKLLRQQVGKIIKYSSVYETASWGNSDQPDFLNQVLLIETNLMAEKIMEQILLIENTMGRVRTEKNASRIIDIDILFINEEVIETKDITIPHPQIQNRNFVLFPLNELSPQLKHPVFKKTIHELLLQCNDTLAAYIYTHGS